jgi:hypothetical protein
MSECRIRFALLLFVVVTGDASAAALTTEFGNRSLIVHGVTPGGSVAVFGLAREPLQTHPATPATVVRAEILKDTDGDGTVQLTLSVPVPRMGMWAVTDLSSGASAAFPTTGYEPRLIALDPDLLKNDNAGQLRKLDWPLSEIDVFVARPGEGAWRFYASKESLLDENRSTGNRSLRIDILNMVPIGDSPDAPHNFHKGDVVAIFDRREMQYGILEVGH